MNEMPSALEWLSEVLFEDEARSTWESASESERAQMLRSAGLNEVPAEDLDEAMRLLVDELPTDQAIAVSDTMDSNSASGGDALSLLDHYVNDLELPAQVETTDEFDQDASRDGFEPVLTHDDLPLEIELGEEFDIQLNDEQLIQDTLESNPTFTDEFEADTIETPISEALDFGETEVDEPGFDTEFDLGE